MTKRRNTVEEEVSDLIASLHAKFKVDKALLFGSTAKGSRLKDSDIDLIVVSKGFEGMSNPERQAAVQREWSHPEELAALKYTPTEFNEVSKRLMMQEILAYAKDVSPFKEGSLPQMRKDGVNSNQDRQE